MKHEEKQQIAQIIARTAGAYRAEFPDSARLDPEWSATAYEDMPGELQKLITWQRFHTEVASAVLAKSK